MNVADGLISIGIWFIQHTIFYLPKTIGSFSISDFQNGFQKIGEIILVPASAIDKFLPVSEALIIVWAILSLELLLALGRALIMGYNMIRGSGAKM